MYVSGQLENMAKPFYCINPYPAGGQFDQYKMMQKKQKND